MVDNDIFVRLDKIEKKLNDLDARLSADEKDLFALAKQKILAQDINKAIPEKVEQIEPEVKE